jgi:hypothetical protein
VEPIDYYCWERFAGSADIQYRPDRTGKAKGDDNLGAPGLI